MVLHPNYPPTLGATYLGGGRCRFLVWAPKVQQVELRFPGPPERLLKMQPLDRGYFQLFVDDVGPGTEYLYRLDGGSDRPDPASRYQPQGVHHASSIVDSNFAWTDRQWAGIPFHLYLTYELHVGTFTDAGTFEAAIEHLDELRDLGVTSIEIMPVAQFPGERNWGYDGVHPFAPQNTYGGPEGMKRLIDAAHSRNLAVVLDVVYNHIGPEGNYLSEFGDYFTESHRTPWGAAINYDDRGSDEVRRFFIENALYWIEEFHVDALRLDAVHAIFDNSAQPFLQELAEAVHLQGERLNRRVYTIAESSLNDSRLIAPVETGGIGIDGQWCDDMHHAIRTELVNDRSGYYVDYRGFEDIVKAYRQGFTQTGEYSLFRSRKHGNSSQHIKPLQLVVCSQNHDQIGNRLLGERLTELTSFEQLKLAASTVILSPYQPLLFMGEEYGETARFQFFVSHSDPGLIEAVRKGRKEEFESFQWEGEPPDPQDEQTFLSCKLNHGLKNESHHRLLNDCYRELIRLRQSLPALAFPDRTRMEINAISSLRLLLVRRWASGQEVLTLLHFGGSEAECSTDLLQRQWNKVFDSSETRWGGNGSKLPQQIDPSTEARMVLSPHSAAVYMK